MVRAFKARPESIVAQPACKPRHEPCVIDNILTVRGIRQSKMAFLAIEAIALKRLLNVFVWLQLTAEDHGRGI